MSVRPWRAGAWVLFLVLVLIHRLAAAAPLARDAVPEPLKPWVPWVLYGHETYACPPLFNDAATRSCVWPSMLEIDAAAGGGRFRYTVDVLAPDQSVPLPGGADSWPDAVQVDRQPAAAMARNDVPELIVPPGRHVITGTLRWSRLPAFLKVPPAGVLRVTRDGAALDALPDASGRMWFASTGAVAAQPDLLTVRRFRLIEDGVPMTVRSRFEIEVGGRAREATIPVALLGGFIPIDLISDLPARLDPEGDLRVQVRPGRWIVQLSERSVKPAAELVLAKQAGAEEVWSFAARPEFRAV